MMTRPDASVSRPTSATRTSATKSTFAGRTTGRSTTCCDVGPRDGRGGDLLARGPRPVRSAENFEGPIASRTVAVDDKMVVETRGLSNSEPFHDCETGAVYNRKSLIPKCQTNPPRVLKIFRSGELNADCSRADALPEPQTCI